MNEGRKEGMSVSIIDPNDRSSIESVINVGRAIT